MQKLAVAIVVLLGLLSVVVALDAPTPTSSVGAGQNVTLRYSSVIGANSSSVQGYDSYVNSHSYWHPQGLSWFSSAYNYSSRLGGAGLFTTDSYYYRTLFYNQNNLNTPEQPNLVFGAPDASTEGNQKVYSVDYSSSGVYALLNNYYVYYWSYNSINLASGNNSYPVPTAVFGNTTSESGLNNYYAIGSSESLAVKKSTGEIFVADSECARIVVYPPTVSNNNQAPSYAIGQNDTYQCDTYYTCSSYSPTTCLYNPKYVTFDCYEGLWVYDDGTVYYFPNNSKIATFAFNGTDDVSSRFSSAYGLVAGPSCNQLTLLGYGSAVFVFQVNYATVGNVIQPTSVSSLVTFGSYYAPSSSTTDYTTTTSLGNVHGAAFGNGLAFLSDYDNHRIVALNLSAVVSNSAAPTLAASVVAGGSQSSSPRYTNSASPVALSSGASFSSSPSFNTEASTSESNSNVPYYNPTGTASQLSSWVNLF